MTLLAFLGVALLVILAGYRVAFYGDALAEKRGWGRAWVGLGAGGGHHFLAGTLHGNERRPPGPGGHRRGRSSWVATLFNLVILSLLDAVSGRMPLRDGRLHARARPGRGLWPPLCLALEGAALWWGGPLWGPVSWYAPAALVLYLLAARLTFFYERRREVAEAERLQPLYEGPKRGRRWCGGMPFGEAWWSWRPPFSPAWRSAWRRRRAWGPAFVGTALVAGPPPPCPRPRW
jgi:cation:H+ antiporter